MTYKLNTRLEIEFADVHQDSTWGEFADSIKPPPDAECNAIGYYSGEDDKFIYLSTMITRNRKKGERDKMSIPKGIIEKIRTLKPERNRK